jgi:hypothetical protein
LELEGVAQSPVVALPASGAVEFLLGTSGRHDGLRVSIVDDAGRSLELPLPPSRFTLHTMRWAIEPGWAGRHIRLRLEDKTPEACLFFDDLWVVP